MHKPLAQALVIIAAAAVASDEPSSGRRLAARRGRRRPVKRETESSHGLKESTPQLGKRAAPDGKTRFMLLSTQRSGTHYVMHELRRHPDVYTYHRDLRADVALRREIINPETRLTLEFLAQVLGLSASGLPAAGPLPNRRHESADVLQRRFSAGRSLRKQRRSLSRHAPYGLSGGLRRAAAAPRYRRPGRSVPRRRLRRRQGPQRSRRGPVQADGSAVIDMDFDVVDIDFESAAAAALRHDGDHGRRRPPAVPR